jgi:hypothetical protein
MFDSDFMQNIAFSSTAIIPIIVALIQMFKLTGWVQDRYAPFVSVLVGIVLAFLMTEAITAHIGQTVFTGIIYGLSASGLYSGIKTSSEAIKMDKMKKAQENKNNQSNQNNASNPTNPTNKNKC